MSFPEVEDVEIPVAIEKKYLEVLQDVFEQCKAIVQEKRPIYGDAWYLVPRQTLDHVISYKSRRMTRVPRKFIDKLIKDHIDIINLSVMALVQLKEEKTRR